MGACSKLGSRATSILLLPWHLLPLAHLPSDPDTNHLIALMWAATYQVGISNQGKYKITMEEGNILQAAALIPQTEDFDGTNIH